MTHKPLMIILPLSLLIPSLMAQKGRGENSEGNALYERGLYGEALSKYQQALEKSPESPIIKFNSGNAQYKTEAFDEAAEAFQKALSAEDLNLRAQTLYNLGNTQYRKKDLQGAVESYKQALRLNPDDMDAKQNLEYVLRELKENPPPQNQQQDSNDQQQNQDQKDEDQDEQQEDQKEQQEQQAQQQQDQDGEEQDKDVQNGDSGQQQDQERQKQENQPQENQEQSGDQQNQQARPGSDQVEKLPMTREQAEQILQALREDQKDLLRKRTIKSRPAAGGKDW